MVLNKKFLKDIEILTEFHHTGELEVYHSLLLKYVPKHLHFSYKGMVARTQFAVSIILLCLMLDDFACQVDIEWHCA